MTTVLTPEEVFIPNTRWPNRVIPIAVSAPEVDPYILGRPRFSVDRWTPDDQYAGPALLPGEIIREARERGGRGNWARRSLKSTDVPYLLPGSARVACRGGASGPIYRDFYADGPADFWPCTRESMEQVGMNAEIKVVPTFSGAGETSLTDTGKAVLVAGVAGLATFWLARRVLQSR